MIPDIPSLFLTACYCYQYLCLLLLPISLPVIVTNISACYCYQYLCLLLLLCYLGTLLPLLQIWWIYFFKSATHLLQLFQAIIVVVFCGWLFHLVPSKPQSVSVSTLLGFPTQLLIRWLPPLELNGILISYTTYCQALRTESNETSTGEFAESSASGSGSLSPMSVNSMVASSNATEVRFSGLMPYTTYECFVTASTSVGESNFSSIVTARTDEAGRLQLLCLRTYTCKQYLSSFFIQYYFV